MHILLLIYMAMLSVVAASSPNIVLIISDDQAWTDYGFMGHPNIKTPHIMNLLARVFFSKEGMYPLHYAAPPLRHFLQDTMPQPTK